MKDQPAKNLVILVADKNMEFAVRGILARRNALGLREISFNLYVHPERDPGCLNRGHDFLRPFAKSHARALILLDHDGCGRESVSAEQLETDIESRLSQSPWEGCAAIVITPELENWVWTDSPHVDAVLGWTGQNPSLRSWLTARGYWQQGEIKPRAPKAATEAAMRVVRKQRSSSLYADLAGKVSLERCSDRAFVKLKATLRSWFGSASGGASERARDRT